MKTKEEKSFAFTHEQLISLLTKALTIEGKIAPKDKCVGTMYNMSTGDLTIVFKDKTDVNK